MKGWLRDAAVVDFESLPIEDRPDYPPMPVGVAIRVGARSKYHAFGHPTGNNCTYETARSELAKVWESGRPILGHNLWKFDNEVAVKRMELPALPIERQHDTMPMLFLLDPRAPDYALKSTAERLFKLKPDERDAVHDWLVEHQPVPGKKIGHKKGDNYAGAFIAFAPGDLVGEYAIGDVDRTFDVAAYCYPELEARNMVAPYERERNLMPVLRDMEQQGVRVEIERLAKDVETYTELMRRVEEWLRKKLRASEDLNLDSGTQLAKALISAGFATEAKLGYTDKGNLQTNKAALEAAVSDPQILATLRYRGSLSTCLETFMRPWLETATSSGGFIYTTWHSTRNDHGKSGAGARTGRLSSTPNFQNLAKMFKAMFRELANKKELDPAAFMKLPCAPFKDLPPLPRVRSYIIPYEKGHVLIGRDASQQELRILAHYEDGALLSAYHEDPWLDVHDKVRELIIKNVGMEYPRHEVKIAGFSILYGSGIGHLAEMLGSDYNSAKALKVAYMGALPDVSGLDEELKRRARSNQPLRTFGGREYYAEEPVWIDGRMRDFAYRMLNLLIQGSAADLIKEAMIRYHKAKARGHRMLLSVHDELLASVPKSDLHRGMETLRVSIDEAGLDVPMKSEGKFSESNWAEMKTYDKRGVRLAS